MAVCPQRHGTLRRIGGSLRHSKSRCVCGGHGGVSPLSSSAPPSALLVSWSVLCQRVGQVVIHWTAGPFVRHCVLVARLQRSVGRVCTCCVRSLYRVCFVVLGGASSGVVRISGMWRSRLGARVFLSFRRVRPLWHACPPSGCAVAGRALVSRFLGGPMSPVVHTCQSPTLFPVW